jgi:hypothetical protein
MVNARYVEEAKTNQKTRKPPVCIKEYRAKNAASPQRHHYQTVYA